MNLRLLFSLLSSVFSFLPDLRHCPQPSDEIARHAISMSDADPSGSNAIWSLVDMRGIMAPVSIPKYTESGFYQITVGIDTTIMADMTFEFNMEDLNRD